MQINITARHFRAPRSLREHTIERISRLERYFGGILWCEVILSEGKNPGHIKTVEIVAHVYRSTLTAVAQAEEFKGALSTALEKLEGRLKKYKAKLREKYKIQRRYRTKR